MTPKRYYTFMIDADLADALKQVKVRDGVPEGEQIRRALRSWFESKGVIKKAARPRARTRGRA